MKLYEIYVGDVMYPNCELLTDVSLDELLITSNAVKFIKVMNNSSYTMYIATDTIDAIIEQKELDKDLKIIKLT